MATEKSFFDSAIPKDCAKAYIDNYRTHHKTGIRSIWLDASIVEAIRNAPSSDKAISGIRVYLAQYVKHDGCQLGDHKPGEKTVVLALTEENQGIHVDKVKGYYNYGNPCPPRSCNGDIGIQSNEE